MKPFRYPGARVLAPVLTLALFAAVAAGTSSVVGATQGPHSAAATQPIYEGPSRAECIRPNVVGTSSLAYLLSLVTEFDALTGTTVNCLSAYLDNAQTWSQWDHPWITGAINGYSTWVTENPHDRQLVLEIDLIPQNLQNIQDPIGWEMACAAGHYDGHARTLAKELVAAGLQDSVIRLGSEMNGSWEPDYVGPKIIEQRLWAKCFDEEVSSFRQVRGQQFLIDWNVNACANNFAYRNYYPGNSYVNILGIDLYNIGCMEPTTPLSFTQLSNEQLGLTHFEAFAALKKKPMSVPEWALTQSPSGDDPGYISGMGNAFDTKDFAFETYFDTVNPNFGTLPLGPSTPLSLAAFRQWFSSP